VAVTEGESGSGRGGGGSGALIFLGALFGYDYLPNRLDHMLLSLVSWLLRNYWLHFLPPESSQ
jgi:hypothetical protein